MKDNLPITDLLIAWNAGKESALDNLLPVVERELRRIAHNYMRREKPGHTLQTSALINEAYLKLIDQQAVRWQNRAHFFGISAKIMRRILLNHARDNKRKKRGGGAEHINLDDIYVVSPERSNEIIALDDALNRLSVFDPIKSKIVEMRYFGGLTIEETAEVMQFTTVAILRHWRLAKSWLQRDLRGNTL